jgi:hypothetical protein
MRGRLLRQYRNIYIALFLVEAKSEVLGDGLLQIVVGGIGFPDGATASFPYSKHEGSHGVIMGTRKKQLSTNTCL